MVDNSKMTKLLSSCRSRGAKFTGLLNQLIVRALSEALPAGDEAGSFVAEIVVDLRKHMKSIGDDSMVVSPSVYYELFPRSVPEAWENWTTSDGSNPVWKAARVTTEGLAERGSSLHDQPLGLLKYLREFYPWMKGKIGKPRDGSYELSNIGSFNPDILGLSSSWDIERVLFSQPANVVGGCLSFNTATRAGGDMVLIMNWQAGVLGVENEEEFAAQVCGSIVASIDELTRNR